MVGAMYPGIIKNSIYTTFGRLTVKAITFFFTVLIVRSLGDKDYGLYTLVWSYVIIFSIFSDAGLSIFTVREMAQKRPNSHLIAGNVIAIRLILAGLTIGLITVSAWLVGYSAEELEYILLASTILLLYAFQDTFDAVLQAHERFDLATAAVAVGQVSFIVVGLLLLSLGYGISGLIWAGLFNILTAASAALYFINKYGGGLHWQLQPRLWLTSLRQSLPFGLVKLWLTWLLKIDVVIMSFVWAHEMMGWYNAAYALILGGGVVSNAICSVLYPVMSRRQFETAADLSKIYEPALKYLLLVSLVSAGFLSLSANQVVSLIYGSGFEPVATVLVILVWLIPLSFTSEFFRYALMASNRENLAAIGLGFAVAFNIIFNLVYTIQYGFLAAAIIAVATELFLVVGYGWFLRVDLSPVRLSNVVVKPLVVMVGVMIGVAVFSALPLFFKAALAGLVATILVVALRVIDPQERVQLSRRTISGQRPGSDPAGPDASDPLVSIFIPAFNAAAYLTQAIDSVLAQTYRNFELIIINDGSTDDTVAVLKQYRGCPQITVLHLPNNMGMAATWNIGIDRCRGQLVAKLDADDFWEPDYLAAVVDFFQKNPGTGLVFSGVRLVYADGRSEPEMRYLSSRSMDRADFLPTLLRLCVIRSPSVCVNRECYTKLGRFIEPMTIHPDWEMWVRIAANYPVGYIARLLANYRVGDSSNVTSLAAIDGRSARDLAYWLDLLGQKQLPYNLTTPEDHLFRWGVYEMQMHFAAIAASRNLPHIQNSYITFAESVLPTPLAPAELRKMRQVHLDLHLGIFRFRERQLREARQHFLRAIRTGPMYAKHPWIWSKLLLTFLGRTKWGILYK